MELAIATFAPRYAHIPLKIEGVRGTCGRAPSSRTALLVIQHCRASMMSCIGSPTFDLVYVNISRPRRGEFGKGQGIRGFRALADSGYEREEARWVREEQRWLKEEQRWMREEARWSAENRALQDEVEVLKQELHELKGQNAQMQITDTSLKTLVAGVRTLLQALSAPVTEDSATIEKQMRSTVALAGQVSDAYIVEKSEFQVTPTTVVASPNKVVAIVTPETPNSAPKTQAPTSFSQTVRETPKSHAPSTTKRALKSGMEGDDVKELQDSLAELGFYSGEEEMEFSTFSSDTARAVKTWQSSIGVAEDGVVTADLLASLLAEVATKSSAKEDAKNSSNAKPKPFEKTQKPSQSTQEASNHREIDKYSRTDAQVSYSPRRVYLLGENRWEEPDRLINTRNGVSGGMRIVLEKCFSCRGEGTTLCTECEGTGDLNVEEQFLEWTGEDAKCPYCEGSGAIACDICYGKGIPTV